MDDRGEVSVYARPLERDGMSLRIGFATIGSVHSGVGITASGAPFWWHRFRSSDRRLHWNAGDEVRVSGGYGFLGDPVANRVEVHGRDQFGEWETVAESPNGMSLDFAKEGAGHISLTEIVHAGGGIHAQA